jgi:hypothetical protein
MLPAKDHVLPGLSEEWHLKQAGEPPGDVEINLAHRHHSDIIKPFPRYMYPSQDESMRLCLSVVLITLFAAPVAKAAEPFTCTELGVFAEGVALTRDAGQPVQRNLDIIEQDSSFSPNDKQLFKKVVREIYAAKSVPPKEMARLARQECVRTGKRKP